MDESGIDMGFDLAALTSQEDFDIEYNDFDQALSMLSTSQDFMYYELKSRAPNTCRLLFCFTDLSNTLYSRSGTRQFPLMLKRSKARTMGGLEVKGSVHPACAPYRDV
ncbi:hypothetical protein PV325_003552 [Microctonus aethiopoides]|nr:hypothetical protein PV325_003552 [Microctonus aethiopoides]